MCGSRWPSRFRFGPCSRSDQRHGSIVPRARRTADDRFGTGRAGDRPSPPATGGRSRRRHHGPSRSSPSPAATTLPHGREADDLIVAAARRWRRPTRRTACAASGAKPWPQCSLAKRQPISTHGREPASHDGEVSIPTSRSARRCRVARRPTDRSRLDPSGRVHPVDHLVGLLRRSASTGSGAITSGSALSAAYAARSASCHPRTSSRSVASGAWSPWHVSDVHRVRALRVRPRRVDTRRPPRPRGPVEHERQPVDRLLVPAHQRDELVGVDAGGQRRVELVAPGDDVVVVPRPRRRRCGRAIGAGGRRRPVRWRRPRRGASSWSVAISNACASVWP